MKIKSAQHGSGYVTLRSPNGDSRLIHNSLVDDAGFLDSNKDGTLGATLPDTDEWLEILLESRTHRQRWTDPTFPPNDNSLYSSTSLDHRPPFSCKVAGWARLSDICQRRYVFRLNFSEEDNPKCCGYNSKTEDAPEFTGPTVNRHIVAAVKAAKKLVCSAFSTSGAERFAKVIQLGGLMTESLNSANMFGQIEDSLAPLRFASVVDEKTYVVARVAEPGYIPILHIQVTVQFSAMGGAPRLFDVGTDSNLASANDVYQGELGDCYLLGALSVLGCNADQIMTLFPTGESGRVQECKSAVLIHFFKLFTSSCQEKWS